MEFGVIDFDISPILLIMRYNALNVEIDVRLKAKVVVAETLQNLICFLD